MHSCHRAVFQQLLGAQLWIHMTFVMRIPSNLG